MASIKQNKILLDIVFKLNDLVFKNARGFNENSATWNLFCLIAKTFSSQGFDSILELLKYFLGVVLVLFIHLFIVYLPLVKLIAKTKITNFFGVKRSVVICFLYFKWQRHHTHNTE